MEKILVTRSSMPGFEEYVEEIRDIWDSHWLTNMGSKHNELEKELADYLKVENVSLFSNGHMALELLIQAMGLTGEVITTPYTFASTTHAIVRNGCTPVFCDINPEDYTIDVTKIEALITEKTSAIIPVHVYGNICNVEEIERIAKKHHLKVIYDAAHTFGVEYKGRGIASFGDAAMFSFHATKVYNTIEGGAVCFGNNQEKLKGDLYGLKNFGIRNEVVVDAVGANSKMNEFQAAMGLCNLRHVDGEIEKRKAVVEHYRNRLSGVPGIRLVKEQPDVKQNYAYFPVIFEPDVFGKSRDEIYESLKKEGIFTRKYFYPITNSFECYRDKYDPTETPVALDISRKVLTLPLYADLKLEDVDRICDYILGEA
jgi:dTDP-4-amino-4,6-dideoxygalactose transaminase